MDTKIESLTYRWKVAVLTLERWRREGIGPRFSRKGRGIFYNIQDIQNYEETPAFKDRMEIRWKKSKKLSEAK